MAGPQRVDLLGVQMSDQQDYWMDWVLTSRKQRAQRTFQKKKSGSLNPPVALGTTRAPWPGSLGGASLASFPGWSTMVPHVPLHQ